MTCPCTRGPGFSSEDDLPFTAKATINPQAPAEYDDPAERYLGLTRPPRERSSSPNRMLTWFDGAHLADDLREVSDACADLAEAMDEKLAEGPEKTAGMRKLLEAKDCFIRARIEGDEAG